MGIGRLLFGDTGLMVNVIQKDKIWNVAIYSEKNTMILLSVCWHMYIIEIAISGASPK